MLAALGRKESQNLPETGEHQKPFVAARKFAPHPKLAGPSQPHRQQPGSTTKTRVQRTVVGTTWG